MLTEQASKYEAKEENEEGKQASKQNSDQKQKKSKQIKSRNNKGLVYLKSPCLERNIIPEDVRRKPIEIAKKVTRNPESKTREKKAKRF